MNLANLNLVLRTRAVGDTGSGGLFNATTPLVTAWLWNAVAAEQTFPYVVQTVAAMVSDNAFAKDIAECRVRFGIWHVRKSTSATDPYLVASNIEARIYGNWSSAAPATAPTYGFHRFTPSFSGWTGTPMEYVTTFDESDGEYVHIIQEYRFWISA